MRALRAQDLKSISCMISNCRRQIFDCMSTPECRTALDCLQACAPNDQVRSSLQALGVCREAIMRLHLELNVKSPTTTSGSRGCQWLLSPWLWHACPVVHLAEQGYMHAHTHGDRGITFIDKKHPVNVCWAATNAAFFCRCVATGALPPTRLHSSKLSPYASFKKTIALGSMYKYPQDPPLRP